MTEAEWLATTEDKRLAEINRPRRVNKQWMLVVFALSVIVAFAVALSLLIRERGDSGDREIRAVWESEWRTETEKLTVWVDGYHSGKPMAVLFVRYEEGARSAPAFTWESTSFPDGGGEFRVGGKVITPAKGIQLLVNGRDGQPRAIAVDQAVLRRLFHRDAPRTLDDLLRFWDDHVEPALEGAGHHREP